jgi:hypothetical protein
MAVMQTSEVGAALVLLSDGFHNFVWKRDVQKKFATLVKVIFSVQNILSSCLISKNLKIKIYKTVILPVVLYGCETWSLTLKEEHRLRVFENTVLRKIFGPKREEDGSWRKLYNDELHSLYSSPNIVRVIKSRV